MLWLPPLIDQATGDPGNMSIVVGHFIEPDDEPIGVERGAELFAVHLNPWRLVAGQPGIAGSMVPAVLYVPGCGRPPRWRRGGSCRGRRPTGRPCCACTR